MPEAARCRGSRSAPVIGCLASRGRKGAATIPCDRNSRTACTTHPYTRRPHAPADLARLPAALVREHRVLDRAGHDGAGRLAPGLRHHRVRVLRRAHRVLLARAAHRVRALRRGRRRHRRPAQARTVQRPRVVHPLRRPGGVGPRGCRARRSAVRDRRPPSRLLRPQRARPRLDDRPAAPGRTAARRQRVDHHDQYDGHPRRADAWRPDRRLVGLPGRVHGGRRLLHRLPVRDVAHALDAARPQGRRGAQAGLRPGRAALPRDPAQSADDLLHRPVRHGPRPPPCPLPGRRRPLVRG